MGGASWSGCRAPSWPPRWRRSAKQPFRAKQLWHWIYHQGVTDFSRMSSIARPLQQKLAERFVIGRPEAADGADQRRMRRESSCSASATGRRRRRSTSPIGRRTAARCASPRRSAAPCPAASATPAPSALTRNLGAAEIVGQFMAARDAYGEWPSPTGESAAAVVHHRADGHGRAAVQLRQRRQGDDASRWTTRASRCRAGASRCPPRASCR